MTIKKVLKNTDEAPICKQSTQSVAFSHYNNISAQLPIDSKTNQMVNGGIREQAKQCLNNIKSIVESVGHGMFDVVKINIYLKNIADLSIVDEVYSEFFSMYPLPARNIIGVSDLQNNALIQIDALISNGEGTPPQEACDLIKLTRNTKNAPQFYLTSQSVAFSHYNHISAQLPVNPFTGNVVDGGIKEQTKQCLNNIKSILNNIDVPFDDIVKVNIYLCDLNDLFAVNEIYNTFFPDSAIARSVEYMPARTVVSVDALPMNALVQIDVTVSHGDGTPPQDVEDRHNIVIRAKNTDEAPICKQSTQSVAFSHYNNISAQLPIDSKTNQMVNGGIREQAKQCLNNIKSIVESVGHEVNDIVKLNVNIKNIEDFTILDEIFEFYFEDYRPAVSVIGVSEISMGALIQIDAIVSNGEGTLPN